MDLQVHWMVTCLPQSLTYPPPYRCSWDHLPYQLTYLSSPSGSAFISLLDRWEHNLTWNSRARWDSGIDHKVLICWLLSAVAIPLPPLMLQHHNSRDPLGRGIGTWCRPGNMLVYIRAQTPCCMVFPVTRQKGRCCRVFQIHSIYSGALWYVDGSFSRTCTTVQHLLTNPAFSSHSLTLSLINLSTPQTRHVPICWE